MVEAIRDYRPTIVDRVSSFIHGRVLRTHFLHQKKILEQKSNILLLTLGKNIDPTRERDKIAQVIDARIKVAQAEFKFRMLDPIPGIDLEEQYQNRIRQLKLAKQLDTKPGRNAAIEEFESTVKGIETTPTVWISRQEENERRAKIESCRLAIGLLQTMSFVQKPAEEIPTTPLDSV